MTPRQLRRATGLSVWHIAAKSFHGTCLVSRTWAADFPWAGELEKSKTTDVQLNGIKLLSPRLCTEVLPSYDSLDYNYERLGEGIQRKRTAMCDENHRKIESMALVCSSNSYLKMSAVCFTVAWQQRVEWQRQTGDVLIKFACTDNSATLGSRYYFNQSTYGKVTHINMITAFTRSQFPAVFGTSLCRQTDVRKNSSSLKGSIYIYIYTWRNTVVIPSWICV